MTQVNSSHAIPVNIPQTLTLTVTHEQLVQLAIAFLTNRKSSITKVLAKS